MMCTMRRSLSLGALVVVSMALACGSTKGSGFGDGTNGTDPDGGVGGIFADGGGPGSAPCAPNAANYEVPANGCDDDNDGKIDNAPTCDSALTVAGDANAFAKSLGICQSADAKHWGLVSAAYTQGYQLTDAPADGQHGILGKYGSVVKPREGASLGVLSSGWAREYDNGSGSTATFKDDWKTMTGTGAVPPGFPKAAAGCLALLPDVHDVISLKLQIKAPANAQGIQFDFNFHSGEWPEYVCSTFNDGFIAFLTSSAFKGGGGDNMSFDSKNNPVSVNNGFFDRCTPNTKTGCAGSLVGNPSGTAACPGGTGELGGTGFAALTDDKCGDSSMNSSGGATGWLTSQAPVKGGETITIEFMVWDTGDSRLDSLVLLDHLTWSPGPVQTSTDRPK